MRDDPASFVKIMFTTVTNYCVTDLNGSVALSGRLVTSDENYSRLALCRSFKGRQGVSGSCAAFNHITFKLW